MYTVRNFLRCINTVKVSRVVAAVVCLIICGHVAVNYFGSRSLEISQKDVNNPDQPQDRLHLIKHIDELHKIKNSVLNELRDLESERSVLQEKMSSFKSQVENIETEKSNALKDLKSLKVQISQTKSELQDLRHEKPQMLPPARLVAKEEDNVDLKPPKDFLSCTMETCFDLARCPVTSQFPVYVYPPTNNADLSNPLPITAYVLDVALNAFLDNAYVTTDPNTACVYIVFVGEIDRESASSVKPDDVAEWLSRLPYWHGDGRNHIIVDLTRESLDQNLLYGVTTGRAIVAHSHASLITFRERFDLIIPTLASTKDKLLVSRPAHDGEVGDESLDPVNRDVNVVTQVPVMRNYLLSFIGNEPSVGKDSSFSVSLMETFAQMSDIDSGVKVSLETKCLPDRRVADGDKSEFSLCGTSELRLGILARSTFSLIVAPNNESVSMTPVMLVRLAEALHSGAVPVVMGTNVQLPMSEFIDWSQAAFVFPKARISELSFLLRSFHHADILAMRRQGKFIYDTYFATPKVVLESTLAAIRTRILIPPLPASYDQGNVFEHPSYPVTDHEVVGGDARSEFGFPPPEGRVNSLKFVSNFTQVTLDTQRNWNNAPGPFKMYSSHPFQRELSSDAKFLGSSMGFRHVGEGQGGTGEVFQESLGGNFPREQFTILMLTYKREEVLMQSIERLIDLPYLNKVIIVWNSLDKPADDLQWPDIGVPVVVILAKKNSLNNRFIPYAEIETDAVLSIDDDAHLRHDEILFGFRVWRELRDRVVGYPGRFHSWDATDTKWLYNSQYTCELSMVLTGAAFLHKYYMYMYTYWMPQAIRDKVDEHLNCEDIAMNFLVSHLTRKPPIKVTSRWTFRCPDCPAALSTSQSHYEERHECINYFVKVFGYMPLLNTQFRVDSVLFKTKLPQGMNKCFKFI